MNITNINAFEHSEHGVILITDAANQEAISYSEALDALDNGSFDSDLLLGFELVLAMCKGERDGFFNQTNQQRVKLWRWITAASFVMEQADNNVIHKMDNGQGQIVTAAIYRNEHAALTVTAATERLLLADHVEGVAYEAFGSNDGALMAVKMYKDFINLEPKKGCRLSDKGREGLAILHNELIQWIESSEFNDTVTVH